MAEKSMATISSEELAALVESEAMAALRSDELGCFGGILFDPEHDACKACPKTDECAKTAKEHGIPADELAEVCELANEIADSRDEENLIEETLDGISAEKLLDAVKESLGVGESVEIVFTPDMLDAVIKDEEKAAESVKISSDNPTDTTTPTADKTPQNDADIYETNTASDTVTPDEVGKPKTTPKKRSSTIKKIALEPVDGPITGEMVGPHMVLRKHPDIDMNGLAERLLTVKPATTTENNQLVRKAILEFGGTQEAVDNSAYGTARRCLQTIAALGGLVIEGKDIIWL